jgi:hypothetical protein
MLGTFFRRQPKKDEAAESAPAPEVPYNPALVMTLTHQHRSLVMQLVKAHSSAQQGSYEEVHQALDRFKDELDEHLRRKAAEFHPYLEVHLRGLDAKDLLREMRANNAFIERAVDGFLKHYGSYPVTERTAMRFGIEISGVSEEFCERLEKEEAHFYTLYMPPEAY